MPTKQNSFSPVEHGCAYLQEWLNGLADNNLSGIPRWYTDLHAATCPYCQVALREIKDLRAALAEVETPSSALHRAPDGASPPLLASLTPERRAHVFRAWKDAEAQESEEPVD